MVEQALALVSCRVVALVVIEAAACGVNRFRRNVDTPPVVVRMRPLYSQSADVGPARRRDGDRHLLNG